MRLPGWFRALLVTVLLVLCVETCWFNVQKQQLLAVRQDLTGKLEFSRQREKKQQYEYDQVVQALPLARAELAELQPRADAAKAYEAQLRQERKALRAHIAELRRQLQQLQDGDGPAHP